MTGLSPRVLPISVPTPFPVGPMNAYLVDGEPLTLIDAGPKTEAAWDALLAGLAGYGRRVEEVAQIVLTHAHMDHYGLLGRVVAACGAVVVAHPRSKLWLDDTAGEWAARGRYFSEFWTRAGVPAERRLRMTQSLSATAEYAESLPSNAVVETVHDGDTVWMGGAPWRVLYTPGHAGSHISLYEPRSRQMIAGDHLLLKVSSNPLLEPPIGVQQRARSLVDYIASLKRVAEMDIGVAWPGHGPPVLDHRALIDERLAHHAERTEQVAALLADGPRTAYDLTLGLFPQLPTAALFLGLSEVVGHLDVLETQQRVREREDDDGLVRYELLPVSMKVEGGKI